MLELVDTHCHIHQAQFTQSSDDATRALWLRANNPDPDNIIAQAAKAGVTRIICVGTTLADSRQAVEFAQGRPACWASIGLHPHEAKSGQPALDGLRDLLEDMVEPNKVGPIGTPKPRPGKIVAIGECGLDYFYNHSDKKQQTAALRCQIELALAHNLPLIFHVREAFDDFWPIFDSYRGIRGVLHSFTDSAANLQQAIARNLFIGVNGIATFTKNPAQRAMYQAVPLKNLLLETDAPFLTPAPLRGRVNEPAYVRLVADFLAGLRGEHPTQLASASTHNALTLFNLK